MLHFGLESIHFGPFWPCVQTKAPSTLIFFIFIYTYIYIFYYFLKHLVFVSFVVSFRLLTYYGEMLQQSFARATNRQSSIVSYLNDFSVFERLPFSLVVC